MARYVKTLEKLHVLESIYRNGDHNELVDRTLDKLIDLERERAQREAQALQTELSRFEQQYQLASEEFYQRFQQGLLGDAGDYFEWSACYDMYRTAWQRIQELTGEAA